MNDSMLFADGRKLCLITRDKSSKAEQAIVMKKPLLSEWTVNLPASESESVFYKRGGIVSIPMPPSPASITMEYKDSLENIECIYDEKGGLLKTLTVDMFKNISVSQMFRIINKKINERNGGN